MTEVETSRDGAVLTITLDRPESLNAISRASHVALKAALSEAADPSIRAVVLTGAGTAFCAGADVSEFRNGAPDIADRLREELNPEILLIRALEKPVIAAVNGVAAGAGLALALACDVRVAAETATLVPGFIGIGLAPDSGTVLQLQRAIGSARAFEWLTTGRRLSAHDALAWGLVSEVVAAEELGDRAREVAELYATMPTRAVWETKRLLELAATTPLPAQLEAEARAQGELAGTADFTEGVAAFLGKREPAFTGFAAEPIHPVRLVVDDDLQRWRLTVLLRLLLAVPHLLLAYVWLYLAAVVTVVTWAITLARGRAPAGLHAWSSRCLRYFTHVQAYSMLIADPFPGFRGWPGTYPVDVIVAPPERQARWKTLLRVVLVVPAYVLMNVLVSVLQVISLIGWFASLALGRMPRGMRDLMAYCLRYQIQTYAYLLLLTSRYPTLASGGAGFQFEEG